MLLPAYSLASQAEVSRTSVRWNSHLLDDSRTDGPFDQEPSKQKPKIENIKHYCGNLRGKKGEKKKSQNPGFNTDKFAFIHWWQKVRYHCVYPQSHPFRASSSELTTRSQNMGKKNKYKNQIPATQQVSVNHSAPSTLPNFAHVLKHQLRPKMTIYALHWLWFRFILLPKNSKDAPFINALVRTGLLSGSVEGSLQKQNANKETLGTDFTSCYLGHCLGKR